MRRASRSSVKIYRVAEPSVSLGQSPVTETLGGVESFTLKYPVKARDAETLMVDPINGDVYVVSKWESNSRVYRIPANELIDGATITMEFKTTLPWGWATGGDISPAWQRPRM